MTERHGTTVETPIGRVVDGDTVAVTIQGREEKLRLSHLDTKECNHGSDKPITPWGKKAKERATELLQVDRPCRGLGPGRVNGSEQRNYALLGVWWTLRAELIAAYRAFRAAQHHVRRSYAYVRGPLQLFRDEPESWSPPPTRSPTSHPGSLRPASQI
jgi:hypothetical protein